MKEAMNILQRLISCDDKLVNSVPETIKQGIQFHQSTKEPTVNTLETLKLVKDFTASRKLSNKIPLWLIRATDHAAPFGVIPTVHKHH